MIKRLKKSIALVLALALLCTGIPADRVIAAVSESASVSSVTATSNTTTVSSQSGLDTALKNKGLTSLTLKTSSDEIFTINKGTYSKLSIVIDAPNATIINRAKVKKITVANARNYNEYVSGNTIEVTMKKAASKLTLTLASAYKKTKLVNKSGKAFKFINNTGEEKTLKKGKKYTSKAISVPDMPIYSTVQPTSISLNSTNRILRAGEAARLNYIFLPATANSSLSFYSSDESVATVDNYGVVTGLSKGTATISAIASNGVYGTCQVDVTDNAPKLTYKLNKEETGYIVTGCKDKTAYMINIPAEYNGLPVVEVKGKAFYECDNLRFFTADKDQKNFYTVDGILYAINPVKTLVKIPNNYADRYYEADTIEIPHDVKAIGDYAFSRLNAAGYLLEMFLPDGLTSMGDYVFADVRSQIFVYVPDSLKSIGNDIMHDQKCNVAFFGSWDSYAAEYAEAHFIPFGGVFDWEIQPTTATLTSPSNSSADSYKVPADNKVNKVYLDYYDSNKYTYYTADIHVEAYAKSGCTETRFMMADSDCWKAIVPDITGKTNSSSANMTGLYGLGYTESEATLIGYDINNKPLGMTKVNGDFVFSFNGAASIGITGGKNTILQMIPYEPTFIASTGYVNLDPDKWINYEKGRYTRYLITCFNNSIANSECPDFMNVTGYIFTDSTGMSYEGISEHYTMNIVNLFDVVRKDQTNLIAWNFDNFSEIYNSDTLFFLAKNSFGLNQSSGKKVNDILELIVETMRGTYYPAKTKIKKITMIADGSFPRTGSSTIYLNEYSLYFEENPGTLIHETIHAIDQSLPYLEYLGPDVWMEGRAEYISMKVCEKLGITYAYYPDEYDWSFLTKSDKADFAHYICYNTNRQTPYAVGYYFIKYISEKYGEDISARIMKKMANIKIDDSIYKYSDEERQDMDAKYFTECVTAETCDTIFDDFVRDVINK